MNPFNLVGLGLWAWRVGALLAVVGALALAVNRFADHYYDRGAADVEARYTAEALIAARQGAEEDRSSLEALATSLTGALAADRAWRAEERETFQTTLAAAAEAVAAARENFDAETRCPATPADVRVFNDAFAGRPAAEP